MAAIVAILKMPCPRENSRLIESAEFKLGVDYLLQYFKYLTKKDFGLFTVRVAP